MANYLYLFRGGMSDPTKGQPSPEEQEKNMKKWMGWIEQLSKQGVFKGGEPLDLTGKVIAGKSKTVTDGPYAEAKDLVGGYLIVDAGTLDRAVELARGCPIFDDGGSVEVRPILQM